MKNLNTFNKRLVALLTTVVMTITATLNFALNITALEPPFPEPVESYFNLRVHLAPDYDTPEKANELFAEITEEYGNFQVSTDYKSDYIGEIERIDIFFSKNITSEEQAENFLEACLADYYATADTSHGVAPSTQPVLINYNEITHLPKNSDEEYLSKYNYVTTATVYEDGGDFMMFLEENLYEDIVVDYPPIPQPAYSCYTYDLQFTCEDWDEAFAVQEEIDEQAMRTLLSYVTVWDDTYRNIIYTPSFDPSNPDDKISTTDTKYVEPKAFKKYGDMVAVTSDNCTDLMAQYIREIGHAPSYMSIRWIKEVYFSRQHVSLSTSTSFTAKDDYIFNSADFPELKITKWTKSDSEYRIGFETFDEAYLAYKLFSEMSKEENSPIISAGGLWYETTLLAVIPTWEQIMDYNTPEELKFNKENIQKLDESSLNQSFDLIYNPDFDYDTTPSPEKTERLRQSKEHQYNSFMPNKWFYEKGLYFFEKFLAIEFAEGYEYKAEDFAEYGVVSIEESFENYSYNYFYSEQNNKNFIYKCMVFDSYESMMSSYEKLKENPNILEVDIDWGSKISTRLLLPTREDVETYLTPAEIEKNSEVLKDALKVIDIFYGDSADNKSDSSGTIIPNTPLPEATIYGDINNDNKVQLADIVVLCQAISAEDMTDVLSPQEIANADVYADGVLNSTDLSVFANAMVNSKLSALPMRNV
jgi:hypothetical protein